MAIKIIYVLVGTAIKILFENPSTTKRPLYLDITNTIKIYSMWLEDALWAGVPAYTGYCLQVKRASDGATLNVGFDGTGYVNVAAITTFCSGTTGYLYIWYDQSGNAYHITPISGDGPIIYESGSLKLDPFGYLYAEFDNDTMHNSDTTTVKQTCTRFIRGIIENATSVICGQPSGRMSNEVGSSVYRMVGTVYFSHSRGFTPGADSHLCTWNNASSKYALGDIYEDTGGNPGTYTPVAGIRVGGSSTVTNTQIKLQTLISWDSDKSADLSDIIATMKTRFDITNLSETFGSSLDADKWVVPAGEGTWWDISGGALNIYRDGSTPYSWQLKHSGAVFDHDDNWEVEFSVSGISFRNSDILILDFGTGSTDAKYGIRIYTTGGNHQISYWDTAIDTTETISPAASYTFKLVRSGNDFDLYRDSTLKASLTIGASYLQHLRIGIRPASAADTMDCSIDDITITQP